MPPLFGPSRPVPSRGLDRLWLKGGVNARLKTDCEPAGTTVEGDENCAFSHLGNRRRRHVSRWRDGIRCSPSSASGGKHRFHPRAVPDSHRANPSHPGSGHSPSRVLRLLRSRHLPRSGTRDASLGPPGLETTKRWFCMQS